jgi:hypothetical protein
VGQRFVRQKAVGATVGIGAEVSKAGPDPMLKSPSVVRARSAHPMARFKAYGVRVRAAHKSLLWKHSRLVARRGKMT